MHPTFAGAETKDESKDISSCLLEAIVQMLNAPSSASELLDVGAMIVHPQRGRGRVVAKLPDKRIVVEFAGGDRHK